MILHIVIELNVFQLLAMLPGHEKSFKDHKNAFLNDSKGQKRFSAIFLSLVCWIDLILHIVIELNVFQLSAMLTGREGSFKDHKNVFLNDPTAAGYFYLSCMISAKFLLSADYINLSYDFYKNVLHATG